MSQIGATHIEATHIEATPVDGPKIRKIKRVVLKISEKKQKAASAAVLRKSAADANEVANAEGVVSTNAKGTASEAAASAKGTANTFSSKSQEEKISLYIQQLTEQQKIVLNIAKEHLATSFCIEKSLGYLSWLKTQQ